MLLGLSCESMLIKLLFEKADLGIKLALKAEFGFFFHVNVRVHNFFEVIFEPLDPFNLGFFFFRILFVVILSLEVSSFPGHALQIVLAHGARHHCGIILVLACEQTPVLLLFRVHLDPIVYRLGILEDYFSNRLFLSGSLLVSKSLEPVYLLILHIFSGGLRVPRATTTSARTLTITNGGVLFRLFEGHVSKDVKHSLEAFRV